MYIQQIKHHTIPMLLFLLQPPKLWIAKILEMIPKKGHQRTTIEYDKIKVPEGESVVIHTVREASSFLVSLSNFLSSMNGNLATP